MRLFSKKFFPLLFLPPLVVVFLQLRYGFDAPYQDSWAMVSVLRASYEGTLSTILSELFAQHNEHRVFFPKLIMLIMARLTHWEPRYELPVTFLFACGTTALFIHRFEKQEKANGGFLSILPLVLVSVLVFSGSQWHVWIWGWMLQIELNVLCVTASFALLTSENMSWKRLLFISLLGLTAVFSFGTGLVFLPLMVIGLYKASINSTGKRYTMLTFALVVSAAICVLYFWKYEYPSSQTNYAPANLLHYLVYLLVYLGSPICIFNVWLSMVFGLLGSIIWIAMASRGSLLGKREKLFWILIGLYAIASGFLTALGRASSNPLNQALSSRYIPIPTLFWISLTGLSFSNPWVKTSLLRRLPFKCVLVLAAISVLISNKYGFYKADEYWDAFCIGRRALIENGTDEDLRWLYPEPTFIRHNRPFLIDYQLSVFSQK